MEILINDNNSVNHQEMLQKVNLNKVYLMFENNYDEDWIFDTFTYATTLVSSFTNFGSLIEVV